MVESHWYMIEVQAEQQEDWYQALGEFQTFAEAAVRRDILSKRGLTTRIIRKSMISEEVDK